jgi:hypothetical protein
MNFEYASDDQCEEIDFMLIQMKLYIISSSLADRQTLSIINENYQTNWRNTKM